MMVAVQSGPSLAGRWLNEERDILSDYKSLFGEEPKKAGAIAIMTDTDNTGESAVAWYKDIILSTSPK
jgi:regulator of sigma D